MERSMKIKSRQFARVGKSRPKYISVSKTENSIKKFLSRMLLDNESYMNEQPVKG